MQYLKRFAVTGSLCPSTRFFGERAAGEVLRLSRQFDRVVVAGVGSGVVADRIQRLCPDAVFVECEARFAEPFARRHPAAIVVQDWLERLFDHQPQLRAQRLLLASFIPTAGTFYSDDIVRMFVQVCRAGGSVIQMRYLPHRMSARFFEGLTDRGIVSERLFTVARNFPPVSMFALRARLSPVAFSHHHLATHASQPVPAHRATGLGATGLGAAGLGAAGHAGAGRAAAGQAGTAHATPHGATAHAALGQAGATHPGSGHAAPLAGQPATPRAAAAARATARAAATNGGPLRAAR
jgi:phospholipid N-methyltransferase